MSGTPAIAASVTLRLKVVPQAPEAASAPVQWELSPVGVPGGKPVLVVWAGGTSVADAVLPSPGRWRLRCLSPQVFAPDIEAEAVEGVSSVDVTLFRAVVVTGTVVPPPKREAPREVVLQARFVAESYRSLEVVQKLHLDKNTFRTRLPMAATDLRVAAASFAPVYVWSFDPASPVVDLGRLQMVAGASLSGRVVREGTQPGGVSLRLVVSTDAGSAAGRRQAPFARTVRAGPGGFFQISGLGTGRYDLEGWASGFPGPVRLAEGVEVIEDAETRLEELRLRDPVRLDVLVDPKLPPEGWGSGDKGWRVRLHPESRSPMVPSTDSAATDAEGRAVFARVNPGRYILSIQDAAGRPVAKRNVDLARDESVTCTLDLVAVRGAVKLGTEPLRAKVRLHNLRAGTLDVETDDEGRFHGWIQRPQVPSLLAHVQATNPSIDRTKPVAIESATAESLDLDVVLEDYQIVGEVSSEDGTPVAEAGVRAGLSQTRSGPEGRFEVRGLGEGPYEVSAEKAGWSPSKMFQVRLDAERPKAQVRLTLSRSNPAKGLLVTEAGVGIPGARLELRWIGFGGGAVLVTGPGGEFTVPAAPARALGHFTLSSSAYPLWSGCVSAPAEGADLMIRVPATGAGEIVASWGSSKRQPWLVRQGGGVLLLANLTPRLEGPTVSPVFASQNVAAGSYALIDSELAPDQVLSLVCSGGELAGVSWSGLGPGQSIRLEPQRLRAP